MADGKIQIHLRQMNNQKGQYWMGNTRIPATVDLENLVWFARVLHNGTLEISAERYSEEKNQK